MPGFFITGTDTDVGKTVISMALMQALKDRGFKVAGMKPVSAGCSKVGNKLQNDDALQLQRMSSVPISYDLCNPFAFEPAIAPHLAAKATGCAIDIEKIASNYHTIGSQVDWIIVEGAGGWLVPLDEHHTMADIAAAINIPVILVVGLRLGCLNHTMLTIESIKAHGVEIGAWVANELDPTMMYKQQNVDTLRVRINAPLLGVVPNQQTLSVNNTVGHLDMNLLDV